MPARWQGEANQAYSTSRVGCRDPDDDKLLGTALMGEADCLITGDRDLLGMSPIL